MSGKYNSSKIIRFSIVAAFCFLLVLLSPKKIFDPVRGIFLHVFSPVEGIFNSAGNRVGGVLDFFGSISELKKENSRLLKENNILAKEVAGLSIEKRENEILREQLELMPKEKFDLASSFVIGHDPKGAESWLMIDKGRDAGLESGMSVIVSDGIMIGKIEEVYSNSAKVGTLSDPQSHINAMDLETGSRGIVRGEYGLGIIMDMVSQSDNLNDGDTVVTSGLGNNIPKGLLIGKIKEMQVSKDKLFQQALVVPRVDYSDLEVVFVVKNIRL